QNTGLFGATGTNSSAVGSTGGLFGQNNNTPNVGTQNVPPVNNTTQNTLLGTTAVPSLQQAPVTNEQLFFKISIPNSITNPVKATTSKV
ncbi:hypothetical protein NE601_17260, partial [Erysipelatoclostridium ramosum]|nr:hypothetical protein [Thomasclavelia ramosa]